MLFVEDSAVENKVGGAPHSIRVAKDMLGGIKGCSLDSYTMQTNPQV